MSAQTRVIHYYVCLGAAGGKECKVKMKKTIQQVSQILDMPVTTIRYYDKKGLLPFIERKPSGYRLFCEDDIMLLEIIDCMKQIGVPLIEVKDILKGYDQSHQQYQIIYKNALKMVESKMKCLSEIQKELKEKLEESE